MTATPERMDSFNLYGLFDYNIAYEIRLQQALEERMLCPFHYVGITDYEKDGITSTDTSDLKWLISAERVDYIIAQTDYYGYSGDRLHGLIFCSRAEEAYELAESLTKKGHPSKALTGADSQQIRDDTVGALEAGDIEYIITVDVFNEGIDIPCINQVVMLRNTQSSIVFVQQLGRGLRKSPNKQYVMVVDFIGNYKNNYLIPIALTGDKSRSRNNARDSLNIRQVSGVSTVNFSKIARERIYEAINNASLDSLKVLKEDYLDLKERLGRIPLLLDFQTYGTVNSTVFANRFGNFYNFLTKMKENIHLTVDQEAVLNFISIELMNGKRVNELVLLRLLIEQGRVLLLDYTNELKRRGALQDAKTIQSVENILSLNFFTSANKAKYGGRPLVENSDGSYQLNAEVSAWLENDLDFANLFSDAIQTGIFKAEAYNQQEQFTLYKRYTRKDVCRLLDWKSDVSSTLYGYRVREQSCPIFVTYSKSEKIENSIRYQDRFVNTDVFQWYTRHNVRLSSNEMKKILDQNTSIRLFIKKSDDDGSDFYYFGKANVLDAVEEDFQVSKVKKEPIVKVMLELLEPARYDKYLLFEK